MSYQEIAGMALISHEIRLPSNVSSFRDRLLSPAIVFVSDASCIELTLKDKGGYLESRIVPITREVLKKEIVSWHLIMSGPAEYVEVKERWYSDRDSKGLLSRFFGISIIGYAKKLNIDVDDDVIGAFSISMPE